MDYFRRMAVAVGIVGVCSVAALARERVSFNGGWRFEKEEAGDVSDGLSFEGIAGSVGLTGESFSRHPSTRPATGFATPARGEADFDDSGWRKLDLPHDWAIEGPFKQEYAPETGKLPYWGTAWYRKHFVVPAGAAGERVSLEVDGAMSRAVVFVNGRFAGGWPYGYASWSLDVTGLVRAGEENVVAIRLENPPDSSRWYPGGGIYRNVWLTRTASAHVKTWGTSVTTPEITAERARVHVRAETEGASGCVVRTSVYELHGEERGIEVGVAEMTAGSGEAFACDIKLPKPNLWSIETPNRYVAVTTIRKGQTVVDEVETPFGVRTIRFDAEHGFYLNGKLTRLNGVCQHHDLGALGAALNVSALRRQLEVLKEMGCNAIRTSHNPPAPELLDLCDRMGLVVMDESFDCWTMAKKPNDYHLLFDDWHEKDLRALVRRDRNHPCVILWSVGNEIKEQSKPELYHWAGDLSAIVHEEDPTRPTTAACNQVKSGYDDFGRGLDVFGFNYKPGEYGKFRAANPKQAVFGSETSSCVSTRGYYVFPVEEDKSKGMKDYQVSSYDLYAPKWATPPDWEFKGQDQFPFVFGEFVWTGWDYLGEPTPYNKDSTSALNFSDPAEQARAERELKELGKIASPSRSSYFGIVDLAGFRKDRFYLYQARWRPELAMAHLLPHWTWPGREGQVTPVHVYTSGDEAELFLNGVSLGRKKKGPFEYRLRWDEVVYQPGELRVQAYRAGKAWATDVVRTAGAPAKLELTVAHEQIAAAGDDLAFVTATVVDASGQVVPDASDTITFSADGWGEVAATDNGDPTELGRFQTPRRKAFHGMALAIVRNPGKRIGVIHISATAAGLTPASVAVIAR